MNYPPSQLIVLSPKKVT